MLFLGCTKVYIIDIIFVKKKRKRTVQATVTLGIKCKMTCVSNSNFEMKMQFCFRRRKCCTSLEWTMLRR